MCLAHAVLAHRPDARVMGARGRALPVAAVTVALGLVSSMARRGGCLPAPSDPPMSPISLLFLPSRHQRALHPLGCPGPRGAAPAAPHPAADPGAGEAHGRGRAGAFCLLCESPSPGRGVAPVPSVGDTRGSWPGGGGRGVPVLLPSHVSDLSPSSPGRRRTSTWPSTTSAAPTARPSGCGDR